MNGCIVGDETEVLIQCLRVCDGDRVGAEQD